MNIKELFTYHPVQTEERKQKHDLINTSFLKLAEIIVDSIEDEDILKMCIFSLQQARMFANQGITLDEIKKLEIDREKWLS